MPLANVLSSTPLLGPALIILFLEGVTYVLWQLPAFRAFLEETRFRLGLMAQVCARLHHARKRSRWILIQLYGSGIQNLHVVLLVGLFIGMIFALQTGIELARFGQQDQIGIIVATGMAREMGPFITAVILAATVGSALAAELGTMSVSDELSALDVMSIDHVSFLVIPRGSQLHVGWNLYLDSAIQALQAYGTVIPLPKDVYAGLFKAFFFGGIVAVISCSCGLKARGGALGVGRATSRAVRDSIIAVIIANYFLTWFIYQS
jgi:phospholipid/cholesterol/gamma-HCH transport system permease protein